MSILMTLLADLLKAVLPELLNFAWEKAHEPTTVENAAPNPALRDRLLAAKHNDPEWAAFHWPSSEILPPDELAPAKRQMDPQLFEQEMLGRFILTGGRAFADFDVKTHVMQVEYDSKLSICWSLDFNINPMCSGIIQHCDGLVQVLDELVLLNTKADDAVTAFLDRCAERGWNAAELHVYGDATGNARDSTSGISDWIIVKNRLAHLKPHFKVPRANPAIKETINAINARLKSAEGASRDAARVERSNDLIAQQILEAVSMGKSVRFPNLFASIDDPTTAADLAGKS